MLFNALESVSTESTLDDLKVRLTTVDRELLTNILFELRLLNTRFEEAFKTEIDKKDIN